MNKKVRHTLEYYKVIDRLVAHATSEPGRKKCADLSPMTDPEQIDAAQQETADALSRLFSKGSTSFGGNLHLGSMLRALELGSTLSAGELLKIAGQLENAARLKTYGSRERADAPADSLDPLFGELEPLPTLSGEIRRCILSEDEIADDASAGLKKVRRSIQITGEKIHSQLQSMVSGSLRTYLQDAVITMRGDRYCIPVKAEYKSQVPGMIHDQSSTGSTFFIEPASIVNLNNDLATLAKQEQEEIEAVLAELSLRAAEHTEDILQNGRIMTRLDVIFAKAALAMEQNATRPIFFTDHHINLRKARHPLLDPKRVVPVDIQLGTDFDLLIVTGPNTGGKTVSIKTVGLLTLMGQAGLHIPAADRSELSIFHEIYADIGDEQSIEQNLSTFSSHMTNLVRILERADEHSLCLFDELCAGTDPTEGAALAISILDHLHTRGIRTMATTHYSELKVYALSTDFVQNACCEFDVESLAPTYRLLIGIPGKSNAFAISSKLGLPDYIISDARTRITSDQESFEDILSDLEQQRITAEKEQLEIASYKARIKELQDALAAKSEKLEASRERILREANEEARAILQEAKDVADETIRIYQKAGPGASMKELEKTRQDLRGHINARNEKLSAKKESAPTHKVLQANQIKIGDTVKVVSMGTKGTVNTLPDKSGKLFVTCGIMRMQVQLSDLVLLQDQDTASQYAGASSKKAKGGTSTGQLRMSKSFQISTEINLLGMTVDEALSELDKYLDDAYLAHLPSVRIVHGKGTGALRQAVQNHLRRCSYVSSYRLGEYGEGDAGVTIAEFK